MRRRLPAPILLAAFLTAAAPATEASSQILDKLKKTAQSAAESELNRKVDRLTRTAVRCALHDASCEERARKANKEVIFTDADGKVITDGEGVPITDASAAAAAAGRAAPAAAAAARPGEGVWANYDFVAGESVLFYEDFANDVVGDFPRRMELVSGNWEVVEWQGRRLLRNTGPRFAAVKVILPRALPEHFTIEFDAYFTGGNYQLVVAPAPPARGNKWDGLAGHFFRIGAAQGTGVDTRAKDAARSVTRTPEVQGGLVPIRILADGSYARVYVGEKRVANIPNADLKRSGELWIENIYAATDREPLYIGPIRVAEGGTDLYRALSTDGRVATRGILFDFNSAVIRPESTPTLAQIGTMLKEHPELRIRIEGHTDATGDDASNLKLSVQRASAVRAYLEQSHGIDGGRLEAAGLGETRPVADNATPEGRQNNRRVELVKLGS